MTFERVFGHDALRRRVAEEARKQYRHGSAYGDNIAAYVARTRGADETEARARLEAWDDIYIAVAEAMDAE